MFCFPSEPNILERQEYEKYQHYIDKAHTHSEYLGNTNDNQGGSYESMYAQRAWLSFFCTLYFYICNDFRSQKLQNVIIWGSVTGRYKYIIIHYLHLSDRGRRCNLS